MTLVTTEEDRLKRREELNRPMIKRLEALYYKTHNKKYLHALKGLGVEVDYRDEDMADEPKRNE